MHLEYTEWTSVPSMTLDRWVRTFNRIYPYRRSDRQWSDQAYSTNRLAKDAHATLPRRFHGRSRHAVRFVFCCVIVLNALRSAPEIALQVWNDTQGGSWWISLSLRVVCILYRRLLIPLNLPVWRNPFWHNANTLPQGKKVACLLPLAVLFWLNPTIGCVVVRLPF